MLEAWKEKMGPLAWARGSFGLLALLGVLVCLSACRARPAPISPTDAGPLPTYEDVYAQAEARVGALDRFWARATVGLRYKDAEGERHYEQGEGHLQFVRPSQVALTIGKLGETYLLLGCDDERFWWIERLDIKRAFVGGQTGARDLAIERVGVPVLPTDLLILADLVPWPAPDGEYAGRVVESDREDLDPSAVFAVEFNESGRTRRVYLTRTVFDPVGVDLFADDGKLIARSELSMHERVLNHIEPTRQQRVPSRVKVDVPSAESRIELNLKDMEISDRRPKAVVFDLEGLIRRFGIDEVIRLEDVRPVAQGDGG